MNNTSVRNVAEIKNIKELTLICLADPKIWIDYLAPYRIKPTIFGGGVKLLLSVTDLQFMKIQFREFVISIVVNNRDKKSEHDSAFLLSAYNSNQFFAWSEKNIFSTPFNYGRTFFDIEEYSNAEVFDENGLLIRLANSIQNTQTPRLLKYEGNDEWRGIVYFPDSKSKNSPQCKCFYSTISGWIQKYEYTSGVDSLAMNTICDNNIVKYMRESNIRGHEWIVRKNSFHSKSATYHQQSIMEAV